jgi:hypothetical protein
MKYTIISVMSIIMLFISGCGHVSEREVQRSDRRVKLETEAKGKDWEYLALKPVVIKKETIYGYGSLEIIADIDEVDVSGFSKVRIYVQLREKVPYRSGLGDFIDDSKLKIIFLHDIENGSPVYHDSILEKQVTSYIDGYVEAPVIGPSLSIIVAGESLPLKDLVLELTVYCLK